MYSNGLLSSLEVFRVKETTAVFISGFHMQGKTVLCGVKEHERRRFT